MINRALSVAFRREAKVAKARYSFTGRTSQRRAVAQPRQLADAREQALQRLPAPFLEQDDERQQPFQRPGQDLEQGAHARER